MHNKQWLQNTKQIFVEDKNVRHEVHRIVVQLQPGFFVAYKNPSKINSPL